MAFAVGSHRAGLVPEQPVGNIDVIQEVLRRGLLLQYVSDGHVEARYGVEAFRPFGEAIDIREGCYLALPQNGEFLRVDLLLATSGQPEEPGHQACADDCGLFGLDQGNWLVRIQRQEVFTEQALREFPVFRQLANPLHDGVNPVDAAWFVGVFDTVAGLGVVHHHLAGTAPSFRVNLEEDGGAAVGDSKPVFIDEALNDDWI